MKHFTILFIILFSPLLIFADDLSSQEIFVTGLTVPTEVTRAGVGVTVITNQDIENIKPNTFDEILRKVPGIIIRQNGAGKLSSLSIRGGNSGSAMILIDGMPVSDTAGISDDIDLSSIPIDNIERIEVIKGAVGASLGSSAMDGAINIITKKGGSKPVNFMTDIQSSIMSFYMKGNAAIYGSSNNIDYRVGGSYLYDEGVSSAGEKYGNTEKDPDSMGSFYGSIRATPIRDFTTNFAINYIDRQSHIDNGGGPNNDALDYIQETKRVNLLWDTKYLYNDIWEPILKAGYTYSDRIYGSSRTIKDDTGDKFDGHNLNIDFQNNIYIVDEFTLTAGINYEYNQIWTRTGSLINNTFENNYAGYLQGTINLFDSWTTILAIRGQKEGNTDFQPIYRLATVYDIQAIDLQLNANIGTGAKAPSLYQLYDPVFGNKNLKMQENFSYEIGFTNGLFDRKLIYGLSWFDNYYNNMISYGSYIGDDNKIHTGFFNETNTHTRGIETSIKIYPINMLDIFVSYTWLQSFNSSGSPLSRRPEHQVQGGINIRPIKDLNISIDALYSGKSVATAFDYSNYNDAYVLLNASISYKVNQNVEIYLKGTNLTNTDYEEIAGYGTKGIELFAGIKSTL